MKLDRRHLIALAAAVAGPLSIAEETQAAPAGYAPAAGGIDAGHYGLRPGLPEDQSRLLQRAINETARARTPLLIPPGVYRVGDLKLPSGAQLIGTRGATKLALTQGSSLISAVAADHLTLSGLALDGLGRLLPERRGLVQLEHCRAMKVTDCEITGCGGSALVCTADAGEVSDNTFTDASDAAIHVLDARRPVGTDPGDAAGIGISVEADTAVTGNVVENAPTAGIMLGWGPHLRDLAATGNVVRNTNIGIAVSVAPGAGTALIANNVIAETRGGAIVGMARSQRVTGDLAKAGAEQYAHIMLQGNRVR
jgi:putative cofactor-binding repeat protein